MRPVLSVAVAAAFASAVQASEPVKAPLPKVALVVERGQGTETCPSEEEVRRAIVSRLGFDPFDAEAGRRIHCSIVRADGRYHARIEAGSVGVSAPAARELFSSEAKCGDLATAVEIALSVAIGPLTTTRPASATNEVAPDTSPSEAAAGDEAAHPPSVPIRVAVKPSAPPIPHSDRTFLVGVGGGLAVGIGPAAAPAAEILFGARLRSLSLELHGRWIASSSSELGAGSIKGWLWDASVAPCLHRDPLSVCAFGAAGVLTAKAEGYPIASDARSAVLAIGVRAIFDYDLGTSAAVRATAELSTPLIIAHLAIDGRDAWTSPRLGGGLSLGLVAKFH